mgnify:CR=1 FL=1
MQKKSKKIGLKRAAKKYLKKDVQGTVHTALEDAKAAMQLYLFFKGEWENSDESLMASISFPKKKEQNKGKNKPKKKRVETIPPKNKPKNKEKNKPVETMPSSYQELSRFLRDQEFPRAKYCANGTGDNCTISCTFHEYQAEATGTKDEAKAPFLS